jgi:REP element-mobilizing transposase RayT
MSRPLRIELPGALYHVTCRGNAREAIYLDDDDREEFLAITGTVIERYHWRAHAYCLMSNHYHLVLETPEPNLSRGMRQLNGVYTQRFNRRHQQVGHVFQGRFKAILVDRDPYLLELCRYVVLNPVRAGMVPEPGAWPWSSYRGTAGLAAGPAWLTTDWLLAQLAERRQDARARYRRFVAAGIARPSPWEALRNQVFLGDDGFVSRLQAGLDQGPGEVPRAQRRSPPASLADYQARYADRAEAMAQAVHAGGYTLRAVADHFGVHYSTVSRAVRRLTDVGGPG